MANKLTEDELVALYHRGADEMPNKTLDAAILLRAKQSCETSDTAISNNLNVMNAGVTELQSKNVVSITHQANRRGTHWLWSLSTAASVCLVALIYWQNSDQYHFESQSSIQQQLEISPVQSQSISIEGKPSREFEQQTPVLLRAKEFEADSIQPSAAAIKNAAQVMSPLHSDDIQQRKEQAKGSLAERQGAQPTTPKMLATPIFESRLIEVDELLDKGEIKQAKVVLTLLLTEHPGLKAHLSERQQALLANH